MPEIVAHAERLGRAFAGAELTRFVPLHPTAVKTFEPRPEEAVGQTLTGTGHRGKYLYLHFGEVTFVVHLMQGGRLRPDGKQAPKPRGGMARWTFDDGSALLLTEAGTEHRAGVWLVRGEPEGQKPVAHLGPDADRINLDELAYRLAGTGERIHTFLRDQAHLAGVGRLLANEILHAAQISPFANTAKLDRVQIVRLHRAMIATLTDGLAHERTLDELGRSADRPSNVHHRIGKPCVACDDEVRSVSYRRYVVAYCPTCQTGGKVLADNTTSRFLK